MKWNGGRPASEYSWLRQNSAKWQVQSARLASLSLKCTEEQD